MKKKIDPLSKIKQLTSEIGIYQFGNGEVPDPKKGFALEDQARALIVVHQFHEEKLENIYVNFILRSFRKDGYFNQFYYEDSRGFVEDPTPITVEDKEEAYGATLWALLSTNHFKEAKVEPIVKQLEKLAENFSYPRAIANSLLGLCSLPKATDLENILVDRLLEYYRKTTTTNWHWFENHLAYANAILPWACWEIYLKRNNLEAKKIAEEATNFLIEQCQINEIPTPIGNDNWFKKDGNKAIFDQQPIDVAYMICCLEKAFDATKNDLYLDWAKKWWGWFWGENIKKIPVVTSKYYCYDGLRQNGVNLNQGAESNICFIMAFLAAQRMKL